MSDVVFCRVGPDDADARLALGRYLEEAAERLGDPVFRPEDLIDDVTDFAAPGGAFLIVRMQGRVIGCGAVRTLSAGVGELKRMWIAPEHRGRGYGRQLLVTLEGVCREFGHRRVRLDTNRELHVAIAMYEAHGYRSLARYNDNADATHFFEKDLSR